MGNFPTAGQGGSLGLAFWPWLTEIDVGSYFFFHGFGCHQAICYLQVFCFAELALLWAFGQRGRAFQGFFFCVHRYFLVAAHSSTQFGMYEAKENSVVLNVSFPFFPGPQTSLLATFQNHHVFVLNIISRCFSCIY